MDPFLFLVSLAELYYAFLLYTVLAVSTRPPDGINYRASRSNSLGPVRSFISIHQVAAATALLLLRAWFTAVRQMALT